MGTTHRFNSKQIWAMSASLVATHAPLGKIERCRGKQSSIWVDIPTHFALDGACMFGQDEFPIGVR